MTKRQENKIRKHLREIEDELALIHDDEKFYSENPHLDKPHWSARRDTRTMFLEQARRELRLELDDKPGVMVLPFD